VAERLGGLSPDDALKLRQTVGWRRWGMLVLYYRAGLSQGDIGRIFGIRRQMVSYEMRRAFELTRRSMALDRQCARRGSEAEEGQEP
jgi:hypothetical protein